MNYQAVILDFDKKTVEYVAPKDVPKPKKQVVGVTGSAPPPKKPKR
jgi:hypothetical protein